MNTTAAILTKARELLSTPDRWARKHQATAANGIGVPWNSTDAKCFCMMGAINRADWELKSDEAFDTMDLIEDIIGEALPIFNDNPGTTHAAVLRVFDQALEETT